MRGIPFVLLFVLGACVPPQGLQKQTRQPTDGWIYSPPEAEDDTGSAYVTNQFGSTLTVACGNAGVASLSLTPDPRTNELKAFDKAVLFLSVDGGRRQQLPATCGAGGCFQDFSLGGEPFPIRDIKRIVQSLRKGSNVDVFLNNQLMQTYSLRGSSRALGAYKQAQGKFCDGL